MGFRPIRYSYGAVVVGVIAPAHPPRVLLVREYRRPDSRRKFPGGKIEKGETVVQAAIREVWQETGVSLLPEDIEEISGEMHGERYVPHFCRALIPAAAFDAYVRYTQTNAEYLQVEAFSIGALETVPDFLEEHRTFLPHVLELIS